MTSPLIYWQLTQGTWNSRVLGARDKSGLFSGFCTLQQPKNNDVPRSITPLHFIWHGENNNTKGSEDVNTGQGLFESTTSISCPENATPLVRPASKESTFKQLKLDIYVLRHIHIFWSATLHTGPAMTLRFELVTMFMIRLPEDALKSLFCIRGESLMRPGILSHKTVLSS